VEGGSSILKLPEKGDKYLSTNFNQLFQQYLKINPDVMVYTVDLRGYGNSMAKDCGNVIPVSGWSEKIFDMIYYIEQGSTVIDEIMKIEL
jgi:hypothetical protein